MELSDIITSLPALALVGNGEKKKKKKKVNLGFDSQR